MACPAQYPYSSTYQNVPVCSNVEPNTAQPSGSHYTYQFTWSVPFTNVLAIWGGTMAQFKAQTIQQLAAKGHTVYNWVTTTPDPYTLQVDFDASSPAVLIVVAVILGLLAVVLYLLQGVLATVVKSPILSVGVSALMIAGAVVAVLGAYLYFKKK